MYFKLNKFEIKVGRKIVTFFPDSIGYCTVSALKGFGLFGMLFSKAISVFLIILAVAVFHESATLSS